MKGYLRGGEVIFPLNVPNVTTVGREGCDLTIESCNVELTHAVIELNEVENCFVLQDLNTAQGTYVNDCRVQNAAVRLAPGDVIRFGFSGLPYELEIENAPQISHPPVQQRPAWSQPLSSDPTSISASQLPYLATTVTPSAPSSWTQPAPVLPRPPLSLRTRPASAGSRKSSVSSTQGSHHVSPVESPKVQHRTIGGWTSTTGARTTITSAVGGSPITRQSPSNELLAVSEKDQRLQRMGDELSRLAVFESESNRKDAVISTLRDEIDQLQKSLSEQNQLSSKDNDDLQRKFIVIESEVAAKKLEIHALKEQMSRMKIESQDPNENPAILRSVVLEREREITMLKQEMERGKKEKVTSQGLVVTLQRDVSNKDSTINRLMGEIERLKKEIREKDVAMAAMSAKISSLEVERKFSRVKENKRHEEELQMREKEIISLKHKLKGAENTITEHADTMETFKNEIERLKQLLEEHKLVEVKLKAELEHAKSQFLDMQRSERLGKVDMEQVQKRLERFRNRVVQQTFCAPGIKAPDNTDKVSDDELIDTIKLLIDDRSEARNKVRELKDTLKIHDTAKKDSSKSMKSMKQHLEAAKTRLQGNRNSNIIKQELKLLQSVTVDDSLHWIKDAFTNLFNEELTWLQGIEDSLEMCGYNIKSSDQGPAKYIENLQIRVENEIKEKEDIKLKLTTIESEVRSEMNSQVSDLKREHEMHVSDVVEKIRAEADQKVHLAVDEVRQAEMEKRLEAIEAEKLKRQDLQQTIDEMRQAVTMKGEQEKEHMTVVTEIEQQMEEMRVVEMKLKDEMVNKEIQFKEEMKQLRDQHEDEKRSHYTEVAAYKEQVRQHAVTIVAMEERLLKITQQQKEMEEERSDLKQQIERIRSKPVPPPKPAVPSKPVIVQAGPDIQALEQLVQVLRRESNDYKKEMQDQQDIILGLRRDLAGASARLSDMTGELSERQKQEMENNLTLMKDMEQELMTQRQQMAKLSELVDKQTNEARKLQAELSDERKLLSRSQNENKQKSEEVVALQSQLSSVQQTQQEITVKKEQEGVIATELASFGAQCRGERHEQVIARQREALAELRSRIKGLEQSRPPIPSGDQALQQVVLLKKELAEMRAQQVSLSGSNGFNIQDATLDQKIAEARGQIPPSVSDTAIERSARIETQEALEESEKTYLELAKAMANQLDLGEISGLQSVTHLPRDRRERLSSERQRMIELMVSRLRVLHQRLERKDELLQDYEKDLARLRQAEHIANEKAVQVESLASEVRSRSEENQYLRETLRRTRDVLEQEKRLNGAIKNKKTYHMEKDEKNLRTWPRHRCYEDDLVPTKEKKKKEQKDKILRKSYEIETLKTELNSKDQQLCDTTAKLINLENSLSQPTRSDYRTAAETIETYHTQLE